MISELIESKREFESADSKVKCNIYKHRKAIRCKLSLPAVIGNVKLQYENCLGIWGGAIPDMLSIHVRTPEIEDRQFPGHWKGDIIKLPHPKPASAANVLQAFTDKFLSIAVPMRHSMTYDQGREMARHKELSKATGIAVYFCDPHSPWQRGSNDNMNGLVRQYLPMGTDLAGYSQEQLDAIADEINNRPRKGMGVRSPLAVYTEVLLNSPRHSTITH